jgi:predicted MPP superfamily phosphohydrolase
MQIEDFSKRRYFPGTTGNRFDIILRTAALIESTPSILFAAALFLLAYLPSGANWAYAFALWAFYLGDWALISSLPRAGKSFGPAKPPTLILAVLRTAVAFLPVPVSLALQAVGTGLVIYGFWIEPHRLTITHQALYTEKLHPGKTLRVLHLGDLHVERLTDRERRLNQLILTLKPDLILYSGDFLNLSYLRDPLAWQTCRSILREWAAPLGVYAVTGSPAVDLTDVIPKLLQDLPLRWLRDEKITLEFEGNQIDVIGLSCTHKPFLDAPRLRKLKGEPSERFTILLYHSPDLAPNAAELGLDLQLSGHTHGGQVRLPLIGALFTGSLYGKRFEAGRIQLGKMILYVTRGIGLEGAGAPRVRFLCPPEIILWEISAPPQPPTNVSATGAAQGSENA